MREIELKGSGYAWRFATYYGPLREYARESDICTYWRAVVIGIFWWAFLLVLVGGGGGYILGDFLAWVTVLIKYGTIVDPEVGAGIILIGTFIVSVLTIVFWVWTGASKAVDLAPEAAPRFVKEAYQSWRDKTCVKVRFK